MNRKGAKREVTAWEKAEVAGIDMSLVESNLRKAPIERIRAHDRALKAAIELRDATRRKRGHA